MNRMRELRTEKGLSMKEAAKCLNLPYTTYINYEKGLREPNSEKLIDIANFYNTSIDYLLCKNDNPNPSYNSSFSLPPSNDNLIPPGFEPLPPMDRVPRVGTIACGAPILAEENIEDYDSVPRDWRADFTLVCKGDSMAPRILDGDLVAIRRQPEVETGEIAAVRIGNEATLKRVYLHDDYIELRPENSDYASIIRRREEMDDVQIEGRAVGFCRNL